MAVAKESQLLCFPSAFHPFLGSHIYGEDMSPMYPHMAPTGSKSSWSGRSAAETGWCNDRSPMPAVDPWHLGGNTMGFQIHGTSLNKHSFFTRQIGGCSKTSLKVTLGDSGSSVWDLSKFLGEWEIWGCAGSSQNTSGEAWEFPTANVLMISVSMEYLLLMDGLEEPVFTCLKICHSIHWMMMVDHDSPYQTGQTCRYKGYTRLHNTPMKF